eukprot:6206690-Pleurochrysis_carterae.AAC.2
MAKATYSGSPQNPWIFVLFYSQTTKSSRSTGLSLRPIALECAVAHKATNQHVQRCNDLRMSRTLTRAQVETTLKPACGDHVDALMRTRGC